MKKVVFFIPTLGQGGAEKVFLNLANEMAKRHEVSFILQDESGVLIKQVDSKIKIINVGMRGKTKSLFGTLRYISILKPDVVFSTLTIPNFINVLASKLSKHKYTVVTRQAAPVLDSTKHVLKRILAFSFKNSDFVIANSIKTKESILSVLNLNPRKTNVQVIYNPIFNYEMYELAKQKTTLSEILISNDDFILAIGRLEKVKDFNLLIKSYSLSETRKKSKLIILGEGSQRKSLEKLILDLDMIDNIVLLGNVSNPYPYYQKAKLFISTSKWEGFGNVIVEALSFGLPIIYAKRSGAPAEILKNDKYGFDFNSDNPLELSTKIDEVYEKKDINKNELINRAKDFSIDKITSKFESTFLT